MNGCWLGNHLVADHPKIKVHLCSRVREDKITMILFAVARATKRIACNASQQVRCVESKGWIAV